MLSTVSRCVIEGLSMCDRRVSRAASSIIQLLGPGGGSLQSGQRGCARTHATARHLCRPQNAPRTRPRVVINAKCTFISFLAAYGRSGIQNIWFCMQISGSLLHVLLSRTPGAVAIVIVIIMSKWTQTHARGCPSLLGCYY